MSARRRKMWLGRVGWLVGIWALSVGALGIVAALLLAMRTAGMR